MAQIFPRSMNTFARTSIFGGVAIVALLGGVAMKLDRAPITTKQGLVIHQPVPFSHEHHYSGLGIDCRYCHTSVEKAAYAGIPPVQTCNNCHSQIWNQSAYLEPVRASFRDDRPLNWIRVHDLPDFVYFNHSIHVRKGVGCETCHGRVDRMPLVFQAKSLQMEWCLDCHRDPSRYVRPLDHITTMGYVRPASVNGADLVRDYKIAGVAELTSCSVCHR